MPGPPSHLSDAQIWAEITAEPRPSRVIDFPRKNPKTGKAYGQLSLVVLTPGEQVRCAAAADAYVRKELGSPKGNDFPKCYDQMYEDAAGVETIFMSARSVSDIDSHFFPSADALRTHLTAGEVAVLINAYAQMCAEIGPVLSRMSKGEMDAWLDVLEAGAERVSPLYLLSPQQKNELILYSADQLRALRKANSSQDTQ